MELHEMPSLPMPAVVRWEGRLAHHWTIMAFLELSTRHTCTRALWGRLRAQPWTQSGCGCRPHPSSPCPQRGARRGTQPAQGEVRDNVSPTEAAPTRKETRKVTSAQGSHFCKCPESPLRGALSWATGRDPDSRTRRPASTDGDLQCESRRKRKQEGLGVRVANRGQGRPQSR